MRAALAEDAAPDTVASAAAPPDASAEDRDFGRVIRRGRNRVPPPRERRDERSDAVRDPPDREPDARRPEPRGADGASVQHRAHARRGLHESGGCEQRKTNNFPVSALPPLFRVLAEIYSYS